TARRPTRSWICCAPSIATTTRPSSWSRTTRRRRTTRRASSSWTRARWSVPTRGASREIPAAVVGGPVAQAGAHHLHAALHRHRLPALRDAAGRAGRVPEEHRVRGGGPAHHREPGELHRAAAVQLHGAAGIDAGRGRCRLRELVRHVLPG